MTETDNKFYQELKNTRNSKKITLKEISEYTKINIKYLEALENGDFNALPNVYTRLFLRSYCDFLSIDYRSVLDEYEIYTLGHKQRDIVNESSLEQIEITDKDEFRGSILEKSKDYKEIIVAAIVIISIIILFTVINNIN